MSRVQIAMITILVIIISVGYIMISTNKEVKETSAKTNQAFKVGYKIHDVVFREHYYNGQCWSFTEDELEMYYTMEGHYKTSQYAYLTGMIEDKHKHWEDQWQRCN